MPKTHDGYDVPFKLNEEILEEVEVDVVRPEVDRNDPNKTRYVHKKEKYLQRTTYIDVPLKDFMCRWEKHDFIPWEPNRFKCEKCGFIQIASPMQVKYNPDTKKLEPRSLTIGK